MQRRNPRISLSNRLCSARTRALGRLAFRVACAASMVAVSAGATSAEIRSDVASESAPRPSQAEIDMLRRLLSLTHKLPPVCGDTTAASPTAQPMQVEGGVTTGAVSDPS